MNLIRILFLLLPLAALPLQSAEPPPVIYVMDFDASQAEIKLGQDQAVDKLFTDVAAMSLSNSLVKQLKAVAPAQRITQPGQAKAPGWLITGSFQRITLTDTIAVTGLYKIEATAVLSDLSHPEKPLASFAADSTYDKGNESNSEAGDGGGAPAMASGKPKSPGEKLADGLATDSNRAAQRIVQLLKNWMAGK